MLNILRAQHLKMKHSFARALPIVAPCLVLLLALLLTFGQADVYPAGAWNWWYAMFLSGALAIGCDLVVKKDKKRKFMNVLLLKEKPAKSWLGMILYCALGLFVANLVMLTGTVLFGCILGTTIMLLGAIEGVLLLTVTTLWEIPLFLWLSTKYNGFVSILTAVILAVSGVVTVADRSLWWVYPPSIPVRCMCPTLGILPNGLIVPQGSELLNMNVCLPAILISLAWFTVLTFLTAKNFNRKGAK